MPNSKFKAKVAIEALKDNKNITEIAAEFYIHPSQVSQWKKKLIEDSQDIFSRKKKNGLIKIKKEHSRLRKKVIRLQSQLELLKKDCVCSKTRKALKR